MVVAGVLVWLVWVAAGVFLAWVRAGVGKGKRLDLGSGWWWNGQGSMVWGGM